MFPSLTIRRDGITADGAFAESQVAFLSPDADDVAKLDALLAATSTGVVAHYYMDPQLQGVLAACKHPHIHISDSLQMADRAVAMAKDGAKRIVVLGVDFMSENVRALLDAADLPHIEVLRVQEQDIGCTLAESAEALAYGAYLTKASQTQRSLHVIYINTSLTVKGKSHALVPTMTCTSSNVVRTVLQAAAQVPGISIWFGPDTYMGENLRHLLEGLAEMDEASIRAVHPLHDARTLGSLLGRFHHFEAGVCAVHQMFGADVTAKVRRDYGHAYITAHLEVPGEMFSLAFEAQKAGRGVVGSTSNILDFITAKVTEAKAGESTAPLSFVLGTEAGMVTSIAARVRALLADADTELPVSIIFPVASESMTATGDPLLPVVPGAPGGEGCSTAGGCATCPFMKMNSLDALFDVLGRVQHDTPDNLARLHPKRRPGTFQGRTIAELGTEPMLHMREFQLHGALPDALVTDILTRNRAAS